MLLRIACVALAAALWGTTSSRQAPTPADGQAPAAVRTILDEDREFDGGSGVTIDSLTPQQIANLAVLGQVWGFLKYHHPAVTAGRHHWDYELFRVLPAVLAARDDAGARAAMLRWVDRLGPVAPCHPCVDEDAADWHLRPALDRWLADAVLGRELATALRHVYRHRSAGGTQFFVSFAPGVGNPVFDRERRFEGAPLPDAGYQLLALFRLWNIVEYWFPYRDLIEGSWDAQLAAFIPRVALARDQEAYRQALLAFIVTIGDGHANLWGALAVRPPIGGCQVAVVLRVVEDRPVVAAYEAGGSETATSLRIGDVVSGVDGMAAERLVSERLPFYAGSNRPARLAAMARTLLQGPCGTAAVQVIREGRTIDVTVPRRSETTLRPQPHDRPGPAFQRLSEDVAYLKLSSVTQPEAAGYVERAAGTKALVIDIRNYPSAFMVFALGQRLVAAPTPFARFTTADPRTPGAFRWTPPIALTPAAPRYEGRIAILVDERSMSQSEYTAMAFRVAPGAVVVGSTTAGADGNVSPIPLPGGVQTMISGIGVFYPDKRPTQRIGIVPDIVARPTIEGLRAGRDEVLEAALRHLLGPRTSDAEIERLARRPVE
jgi:C-terminal processing protease CtpA/Prc